MEAESESLSQNFIGNDSGGRTVEAFQSFPTRRPTSKDNSLRCALSYPPEADRVGIKEHPQSAQDFLPFS